MSGVSLAEASGSWLGLTLLDRWTFTKGSKILDRIHDRVHAERRSRLRLVTGRCQGATHE